MNILLDLTPFQYTALLLAGSGVAIFIYLLIDRICKFLAFEIPTGLGLRSAKNQSDESNIPMLCANCEAVLEDEDGEDEDDDKGETDSSFSM